MDFHWSAFLSIQYKDLPLSCIPFSSLFGPSIDFYSISSIHKPSNDLYSFIFWAYSNTILFTTKSYTHKRIRKKKYRERDVAIKTTAKNLRENEKRTKQIRRNLQWREMKADRQVLKKKKNKEAIQISDNMMWKQTIAWIKNENKI